MPLLHSLEIILPAKLYPPFSRTARFPVPYLLARLIPFSTDPRRGYTRQRRPIKEAMSRISKRNKRCLFLSYFFFFYNFIYLFYFSSPPSHFLLELSWVVLMKKRNHDTLYTNTAPISLYIYLYLYIYPQHRTLRRERDLKKIFLLLLNLFLSPLPFLLSVSVGSSCVRTIHKVVFSVEFSSPTHCFFFFSTGYWVGNILALEVNGTVEEACVRKNFVVG
ncbi:hypothetical protein F4810DRAFT_12617 [Camillea tinctor]|nr:hypothetical protein F4810DRAFT_12617 [Camillea tinctor]